MFGGGWPPTPASPPIWAAVTAEGYYGPVFWPAVGLLFVIAAGALWGALRIYRGRAGASTTGKRQARAVGRFNGGRRPRYGYTLDLEGQLQPEPGEQRTVARIQRMRAEGASLRKIEEAVGLHPEHVRRLLGRSG